MPSLNEAREQGENEQVESSREILLSAEDLQRLDALTSELSIEQKKIEDGEVTDNFHLVVLRRELVAEGPKATEYCLGKLSEANFREDQEVNALLGYLYLSASEGQAGEIAALFVDHANDLTNEGERRLLATLARVGTPAEAIKILPQLKTMFLSIRSRVLEADDPRVIGSEVQLYLETLAAIANRTEDEQESHSIKEKITELNDIIPSLSLWHFEPSALQYYGIDASPEAIQSDYANLFELVDYTSDSADDPYYFLDFDGSSYEEEHGKVQDRAQTVKNLRLAGQAGKEVDPERALYYLPKLEWREKHPSPYAPTLGIEIEIYHPSFNDTTIAFDEMDERERKRRADLKMTRELGVPSGGDGYWEFANAPVHHFQTLTREVQALMDMQLINRESKRHPLHLTIGGVTSVGEVGQEAFVLARALEATAWSTSGGRLLKPKLVKKLAWNYKGVAGVNEREPSEMAYGTQRGIEIRTLQLQSLTGLHRTLSAAYSLGAALKAYQGEQLGDRLGDEMTSETRAALAEIWGTLSSEVKKIFDTFDVKTPRNDWEAPDSYGEGDFGPMAHLLDDASRSRESEGGKFVSQVRDAVTQARVQVAAIMRKESETAPAE